MAHDRQTRGSGRWPGDGPDEPPSDASDVGWLFIRGDRLPDRWAKRAIKASLVPLLPEEYRLLVSTGRVEPQLEAQQAELLELLTEGLTIDQIARRLDVNTRTVQRRLAKLRAHFSATSTADLIVEAARRGF